MALYLTKPGLSTVTLPNFTYVISKNELKAGDLVMNGGPGTAGANGHVIIFEKWANSQQTAFWAYEQTPPYAQYHIIQYPGSPYKAYRYSKIVDGYDLSNPLILCPIPHCNPVDY
jgi:hypothetical protein